MFVVTYKKFWFILSALLLVISIAAMAYFGFDFGIDFKGGTITQVAYTSSTTPAVPTQEEVITAIQNLNYADTRDSIVQPAGNNSYIIRTRELTAAEKEPFLAALSINNKYSPTVERYDSIGPVVGEELKNKSYTAIALVVLCIVIFITYAFRKVSQPVASWKYGLATVISLLHDVIIPTGIFIIYAHYRGGEIDVLFVSAILAILGYSVHDTIVVFDRVREHLRINQETGKREDFETTVGKSVSETFGRSINTSVTIFLVLAVLYAIGGSTTQNFAFVLLVGVVIGTYSSIFVATPLLVLFEKWQKKS